MSNRRRLARERLEYVLTYILLAYRRLVLVCGLLLLVYAILTMVLHSLAGNAFLLLPAIYLLLLSNSYNVTLYTARFVAWILTLWGSED